MEFFRRFASAKLVRDNPTRNTVSLANMHCIQAYISTRASTTERNWHALNRIVADLAISWALVRPAPTIDRRCYCDQLVMPICDIGRARIFRHRGSSGREHGSVIDAGNCTTQFTFHIPTWNKLRRTLTRILIYSFSTILLERIGVSRIYRRLNDRMLFKNHVARYILILDACSIRSWLRLRISAFETDNEEQTNSNSDIFYKNFSPSKLSVKDRCISQEKFPDVPSRFDSLFPGKRQGATAWLKTTRAHACWGPLCVKTHVRSVTNSTVLVGLRAWLIGERRSSNLPGSRLSLFINPSATLKSII